MIRSEVYVLVIPEIKEAARHPFDGDREQQLCLKTQKMIRSLSRGRWQNLYILRLKCIYLLIDISSLILKHYY